MKLRSTESVSLILEKDLIKEQNKLLNIRYQTCSYISRVTHSNTLLCHSTVISKVKNCSDPAQRPLECATNRKMGLSMAICAAFECNA